MTTATIAAPALSRVMSKEASFTLIELITVIAILGVLVAVSLPRFLIISDEAHRSEVAQTAAAFGSAVQLAYAACTVRRFAGQDNIPSFGAGNLDFNPNCFPASTNGTNTLTVNPARCVQVWNGLLSPAPSISTPASDDTDYRAQGSGTVCTYRYRGDTDTPRRFTYNAATGAISVMNP